MLFCQIVMLLLFTFTFFTNVYHVMNGRKAMNPLGYDGFIIALVLYVLCLLTLWGAGALSLII